MAEIKINNPKPTYTITLTHEELEELVLAFNTRNAYLRDIDPCHPSLTHAFENLHQALVDAMDGHAT